MRRKFWSKLICQRSSPLGSSYRFTSETGVDSVVEFEYPRLPPKCTNCKKWGHLKEICQQRNSERVGETIMQIGVNDAGKVLASTLKEMRFPSTPEPVNADVETNIDLVQETPNGNDGNAESNPEEPILSKQVSEKINSTTKNSEEEWISVSPNFKRHSSPPKVHEQAISISSSRYSILVEEEEEETTTLKNSTNNESQYEEGEIMKEHHKSAEVIRYNSEEVREQGLRPTIPRSTKSVYKSKSDSFAKDTLPGVSGKRVTKKKI